MNSPPVHARSPFGTPAAAPLPARQPVRAGAFIVTLYGDAVEPRGGVLWMGTLIEVCADFGLSESLVRTAVSRLVAAGRLAGERASRRSFYRLTPEARTEFAAVSARLFAPRPAPEGWLVLRPLPGPDTAPGGDAPEDLRRAGWAPVADGVWLAADTPDRRQAGGLMFGAGLLHGGDGLRALAHDAWPLAELAEEYRRFVGRFAPLLAAVAAGARLAGRDSLTARLALVHQYRGVVLRDPQLPSAALPAHWPGPEAGRLFSRLYAALSGAADSHIGATFRDAAGLLPCDTDATRGRLSSLERAARP